MVVPTLMELRKEGESGRRKITQYTRYGTVVLALFQSFGAAGALQKGGMTLVHGWPFLFTATVTMTTGTMFLMWLGEQITERGIGNGISMIILVGHRRRACRARVGSTFESVSNGEMQPAVRASAADRIVLGVTVLRACSSSARSAASRCNYAKRQVGRRMYAGQTQPPAVQAQHVGRDPADLRLEPAAVPGDASRASSAPARDARFGNVLQNVAAALGYGQPLHLVLYAALIIFFCFFYTALVFNARETADNLKKSGAFIPRHPPGPADRRVHRRGADAPDAVGRAVRHRGVPAAGDPGFLAGRAVPVRRHLAPDRRRGGHGFHGAAAGAHDVASVPGAS